MESMLLLLVLHCGGFPEDTVAHSLRAVSYTHLTLPTTSRV